MIPVTSYPGISVTRVRISVTRVHISVTKVRISVTRARISVTRARPRWQPPRTRTGSASITFRHLTETKTKPFVTSVTSLGRNVTRIRPNVTSAVRLASLLATPAPPSRTSAPSPSQVPPPPRGSSALPASLRARASPKRQCLFGNVPLRRAPKSHRCASSAQRPSVPLQRAAANPGVRRGMLLMYRPTRLLYDLRY